MKNSIKKLTLGKTTIANLDQAQMNQIVGGWSGGCSGGTTTFTTGRTIKK